jgi:hypothetical protein
MPAQFWQRCQQNGSTYASTTKATMPTQQLQDPGAMGALGDNASLIIAKMPVQQGQSMPALHWKRCQCNKGDDTSATRATISVL